ncbi:LysM peptidoglycan-binding domain-containing protein [Neobacillus sp. PS3-12]|jgi:nucleoid-associated protein YgaU|uniref:cell division suppressor protein YneA n=1 Tax=Neobacillus sp. PS3-12 TaxID=3070677 RepID=UPI0027E04259|nr:LysM peptidoglycan-binding domain-containing protein [Neobacillus sp. PS3-12]WML52172.1 LysM peptidoglycan-binding domain-containing protein [Neobacillus sp. PS3-12]
MKKLWNHYSYAIILILISLLTSLVFSIRFDTFHQKQYVTVTVSQGDTLWKIADNYLENQSLSKVEFVDWVKTHNQIDEDRIFPGEKIMIPISSNSQPTNDEFASAVEK